MKKDSLKNLRKTFYISQLAADKIKEISEKENVSQSKVVETSLLFYVLMQNDQAYPFKNKDSFLNWKAGIEKDWHMIQLVLLGQDD